MPDPGFTRPDLCSTCAVRSHLQREMLAGIGTGGGWLITGRRSRRTAAGR